MLGTGKSMFDALQLLKMGLKAFQKEVVELTGTVSKTGSSSMPLPLDRFMVNQTVEMHCGSFHKSLIWPLQVRL